ncbi:MAG: hypothetical protein J7L08_02430 [Candidatus Aenigmarchaeota archaeon]|nr:hypothetical protein [Candidatus Aenigmarchaeota archaeon]
MKKGMSLPINIVVILVVAVIVLLAVVVFFMGSFSGSSEGMDCESKLRTGCTQFVLAGGCDWADASKGWPNGYETLKEGVACTLGGDANDVIYTQAQELCCTGSSKTSSTTTTST